MKLRPPGKLRLIVVLTLSSVSAAMTTGCGLRDAVTKGFFGAISDAVGSLVSELLLPGG